MKDLHSHYLPGVDDGAKTIDSTRRMLKSASENGVTHVMFTPHYVPNSEFSSPKKYNEEIFASIKTMASEEYGVQVYLGNEVYLTPDILDYFDNGDIRTLNGGNYALFELPMFTELSNVKSIFLEIINRGIVPILAHPERYISYYKNYDFFFELRSMGVLMQINYPSLIGMYGSKAKKMAKELLKMNLISFVGSDIHSASEMKYENLAKMNKKLLRIVGEEKFLDLTENNFVRVINNEVI